jgi:hypothetical protein
MKGVEEVITPAYADVCQAQMADPLFRAGLRCALTERAMYYYVTSADVGTEAARWCAGWNVGVKHTREEALAKVPLDIAILISRELNGWTRILVAATAA